MTNKIFPQSQLPIRKTVELLPGVFQTETNDKFLSAVVDPLVQPGLLNKSVGYIGRRYGKTYTGTDIYLETDNTLRSRYQLEPGVVFKENGKINNFYDYIDFKNQLKFFGSDVERDDKVTSQDHYSWSPPISWDKFINYREYFWEPNGPLPILVRGKSADVVTEYFVSTGVDSYMFAPSTNRLDVVNNPTLTLYRGQTYKFKVNAPSDGMFIRTMFDTGSLLYNATISYELGQIVVFNGQLWRATKHTETSATRTTLDPSSWEFVEILYQANMQDFATTVDYNAGDLVIYQGNLWKALVNVPANTIGDITSQSTSWKLIGSVYKSLENTYYAGVTNNGATNDTITFTVPYNAPDALFYQSIVDPNKFGKFIISTIDTNTVILDVSLEIIGVGNYTTSTGTVFTNGLVVEFSTNVTPEQYKSNTWIVNGVGSSIQLTKFADLYAPDMLSTAPEVLFDNGGFDTLPFDAALAYPETQDYVTIAHHSQDSNPWSRYNRWFHRSVLEYSYQARGQDYHADESARAKRPIIEFTADLQLFNHGSIAKTAVDFVDTTTIDVFSIIEGSTSFNIDGENLFDGARILITSDTDILANNKIYRVEYITHNHDALLTQGTTLLIVPQIHLVEDEAEYITGECVLVKRGAKFGGKMYHYNGTSWILSQHKTAVNQSPLFDVYDDNGVSFADVNSYPASSFSGTSIVSYKIGNGKTDQHLGFSLSYLNIDNVGDIEFNWNYGKDSFRYVSNFIEYSVNTSSGFYKINSLENQYYNGWTKTNNTYIQPIIDSQVITESTNTLTFSPVYSNSLDQLDLAAVAYTIAFYINDHQYTGTYTRVADTYTFNKTFAVNDVVTIKVIADTDPNTGYYEMPVGLEKNPLNQELLTFTLGQANDHIKTAIEYLPSFSGNVPGVSNLRDISGFEQYATRFLKHAGVSALPVALLCDKTHNIVKSIQYCKAEYSKFKNNFLSLAETLNYNSSTAEFVDEIISEMTKTKTTSSPFSKSDMIGSGAYTSNKYTIEDNQFRTFSLREKFSLTELSSKAVYVYLHRFNVQTKRYEIQQLVNTKDYTFNSVFGFVIISNSVELFDMYTDDVRFDNSHYDIIEINEYNSTGVNYIPATPSSIGLYKKFLPSIFVDDTYVEPREVLQGHDGSITLTYGDFRDKLLLELELRIYNNIKQAYNPEIFDIDTILGGYYNTGLYSQANLNMIIEHEFFKWVRPIGADYTNNTYLDPTNPFTYTYSTMTNVDGTQSLPGYWRGVYMWMFDTDRPHRCPWEMLGFSEQPEWWSEEYGDAPYTSDNLLLWEDLRDGVIRQGTRAGVHIRYARPDLLDQIPVDNNGNLLSPLDARVAKNFSLIKSSGTFEIGDIGPTEYAWRSSSEWPFATMLALCLLKPFEFISDRFDVSRMKLNSIGQTVCTTTNSFITLNDLVIPTEDSVELTAGLVTYLIDYVKSQGTSIEALSTKIKNLDVNLSTRMSGFVITDQQKFLLDSKSHAASQSVFVPAENYDIIFNVSSSISTVAYSGVIFEKSDGGWLVFGYDSNNQYFSYYEAVPTQGDTLMSVGGVSDTFVVWSADTTFVNGTIVRYGSYYYRAITTSNRTKFNAADWVKLSALPITGAISALKRREFNTTSVKRLKYGTLISTIQEAIDLLLGIEVYLQSQGFVFDQYDPTTRSALTWTTSCKEFMFWTKHNWSNQSMITLSPAASRVEVNVPGGTPDSIIDGFYDYELLKGDGQVFDAKEINVNRTFRSITLTPSTETEGIYFVKLYYVLKEHVTVFSDRTVFNDVIYDKTTGYRQGRIKSQGFKTVDWDGDYTSPGFIFDNVDIKLWRPTTDYQLGDIVSYRSNNWTCQQTYTSGATFDNTYWSKLDTTPEKQLVSNFDYKINQFEEYYDVDSGGIGETQRSLAKHAVGYQTRQYLQDLAEDPTTQFQLYQGFIREKGTINAVNKVVDKLSRSGDSSIVLNEEWAFNVGKFGGVDQVLEVEFEIAKSEFKLNPQPILFSQSVSTNKFDQYYRITQSNFTLLPGTYSTSVYPVLNSLPIRTAGYVRYDQVDALVKTTDDILTLDITTIPENGNIWVTFDYYTWNVVRLNENFQYRITGMAIDSNKLVTVTLATSHLLPVGDIIGIKPVSEVTNISGFFKIISKTSTTIVLDGSLLEADPVLPTTPLHICVLSNARFKNFSKITQANAALLPLNAKLWIDNDDTGGWSVVSKQQRFASSELASDLYGTNYPSLTGEVVAYASQLGQVISSMSNNNKVLIHEIIDKEFSLLQIIEPPVRKRVDVGSLSKYDYVNKSFGKSIAISEDNRFLVIGSPYASYLPNAYRGVYDPTIYYHVGDIVLYRGMLWEAIREEERDGSTISIYTSNWKPATIIKMISEGLQEGFNKQGMISVYEMVGTRWKHTASILSPRPNNDELFGSNITIGQLPSGDYIMTVSAVGALVSTGKVYTFTYTNSAWKHYENINYRGIYNPTLDYNDAEWRYPAGSVVWHDHNLLTATIDTNVITSSVLLTLTLGVDAHIGDVITQKFTGARGIVQKEYVNSTSILVDVVHDKTYVPFEPNTSLDVLSIDSNSSISAFGNRPVFCSSVSEQLKEWIVDENMNVQCYLPSYNALENDGSTLVSGIANVLVESIKVGDEFGSSVALSGDAQVLVVGAPLSDQHNFASYKGIWRSNIIYLADDVVKYAGQYYTLDSTESYNQIPTHSPWSVISDTGVSNATGKVFVYKYSAIGHYQLIQTISAEYFANLSIDGISNTIGDQFGHSVTLNGTGSTLLVSCPFSNAYLRNQGVVYVFNKNLDGTFSVVQQLSSFETLPNELFGSTLSTSVTGNTIVIASKNPTFATFFEFADNTIFDNNDTRFYSSYGNNANVYVFEKKSDGYLLTEKLNADWHPYESFGSSLDCTDDLIVTGSPNYRKNADYTGDVVGMVRLFSSTITDAWLPIAAQADTVDLAKIKSISLYDNITNVKIQDLDYIDHAKLKVLNIAEKELAFKTIYDPAVYSIGTNNETQTIEPTQTWTDEHVGELWWDVSTAKWAYSEQGDKSYRTGVWSKLLSTASIDVYEWVKTVLLPSEWSDLADTNEGLASGISGQPLYPDDTVMAIKQLYNSTSGLASDTYYYYWVKQPVVVPTNKVGRSISAASVASAISNPIGTGITFVAIVADNQMLAYNFSSVMSDTALLNIQYYNDVAHVKPVHHEYQLISEGNVTSLPSAGLERKWIDSLVGYDSAGNRVPDPALPEKQKYGISFRPRQGMFIDRLPVLKMVIGNINTALNLQPYANTIDYTNLNLVDSAPSTLSNLYDTTVDSFVDLSTVSIARAKQATLALTITNGKISKVTIVNQGYGYKPSIPVYQTIEVLDYGYQGVGYQGPLVTVEGNGKGAAISVIVDNQGQVIKAEIVNSGQKYSTAVAIVRNFSVLVSSDESIKGMWSIYAYDDSRLEFTRVHTQAYNTTKYWSYSNWWQAGYSSISRIVKEINVLSDHLAIHDLIEVGDIIRINEYENGGWALFERILDLDDVTTTTSHYDLEEFSDYYKLVGRENGTIQLNSSLYNGLSIGTGFDALFSYDSVVYDLDFSIELRNIFKAVKEDIFIGSESIWNSLFFTSVRAAFTEQMYVDWAFKTSFLTAIHNIGPFKQPITYKSDNLESFQSFVDEVKPYRTTVREYISRYNTVEPYGMAVSDFDLSPIYSSEKQQIVPVTEYDKSVLAAYPAKWWKDNYAYSVSKIAIVKSGEFYNSPPNIIISGGGGSGATAKAYIANGKVSLIEVTNPGYGYTSAPTVVCAGGSTPGSVVASAVAIIGNATVRTFNISLKFDRITKEGLYKNLTTTETFTNANIPSLGSSSVIALAFPPNVMLHKTSVYKNSIKLLGSEFKVEVYTDSTPGLKGRLVFASNPSYGDTITITYEKHDSILDSVNRVYKYYQPVAGMRGSDLSQLMTGIDFGGVQVQGTTFDVTGGWDESPWDTDNWDSVESNNDFYYQCTGTTDKVVLPYIPADGEEINIYLTRNGVVSRVDAHLDESSANASSTALIPTFIGDGSTSEIEIGYYLVTAANDLLVFRSATSDGSLNITDSNIVDTNITGGTLENLNLAYTNATGVTADEIIIEGGSFISPAFVPATEEHVPGQVLDSVSIKVYNRIMSNAAPIHTSLYIGDGITTKYNIGLKPTDNAAIAVYVNKVKQSMQTNYIINLKTNTISFAVAPDLLAKIEIIVVGFGGVDILDYKTFIATGKTSKFTLSSLYSATKSVYVTLNGEFIDTGYTGSVIKLVGTTVQISGKTVIDFGIAPQPQDVIQVVSIGSATDTYPTQLVQIKKEEFVYDGSTKSFELNLYATVPTTASSTNILVAVNDTLLTGINSTFVVYDGIANTVVYNRTPLVVLPDNVKVFVNGVLTRLLYDYEFNDDMTAIVLLAPVKGDKILIENDAVAEFKLTGNTLTILTSDLAINDTIEVTWFNQPELMTMLTIDKPGGYGLYNLTILPVSVSYVWVYKNGMRLTQDVDYTLNGVKIYLTAPSLDTDLIKIVTFALTPNSNPKAFEIHKDMLNRFHFNRFANLSITLARDLAYYDQEIYLTDATDMFEPTAVRNTPGVIIINKERIEYLKKTGNMLSQLRRGSAGTGIAVIHTAGSAIVDVGPTELLPYQDIEYKTNYTSDGSSMTVGPLNFTPMKSNRIWMYSGDIPETYGACDQIEVFFGGKRLRKDPVKLYNEELGESSPIADEWHEAEFSVDGTSPYIRISNALIQQYPVGTQITVYRKTGQLWGVTSGVPLIEDISAVGKFISQKSTALPE